MKIIWQQIILLTAASLFICHPSSCYLSFPRAVVILEIIGHKKPDRCHNYLSKHFMTYFVINFFTRLNTQNHRLKVADIFTFVAPAATKLIHKIFNLYLSNLMTNNNNHIPKLL